MQRRHDAVRGVHAGRQIGDRDAGTDAPAALFAGDAHHPAFGLQDQVERGAVTIRSRLAEAGDRAIDDARVARTAGLVAEPELVDHADAVILEDDVGALHQLEEQVLALGVLEVDDHALLVAMETDEVRRLAAVERRAPRARDVAARRLDRDDPRAEVAEHRRRERTGVCMREVDHRDIVEREHAHAESTCGRISSATMSRFSIRLSRRTSSTTWVRPAFL